MSDCELPSYYVWKEPVARKPHKCCECDAPILPGEKYLQVNCAWDGEPYVYRQHLLCAEACELVRDSGMNDGECVYYGGLWEFWSESRGKWWPENQRDCRRKLWRLMLRIRRRE